MLFELRHLSHVALLFGPMQTAHRAVYLFE
jgi:hypothetical protein